MKHGSMKSLTADMKESNTFHCHLLLKNPIEGSTHPWWMIDFLTDLNTSGCAWCWHIKSSHVIIHSMQLNVAKIDPLWTNCSLNCQLLFITLELQRNFCKDNSLPIRSGIMKPLLNVAFILLDQIYVLQNVLNWVTK